MTNLQRVHLLHHSWQNCVTDTRAFGRFVTRGIAPQMNHYYSFVPKRMYKEKQESYCAPELKIVAVLNECQQIPNY